MSAEEIAQRTAQNNARLKEISESVVGDFFSMHHDYAQDSVLSLKEKELIALGIGIALRCEGCLVSHLKKLITLQVKRAEIVETIETAIVMGGGPAVVYGGRTLELYDELNEQK